MTYRTLINNSITHLAIFEMAAACPLLPAVPFADTAAVDAFFLSTVLTDVTHLGCFQMFSTRTVLDYFAQQMRIHYPTINYIDILDRVIDDPIDINDAIDNDAIVNDAIIRFSEATAYFTTALPHLLAYIPLAYPVKPDCTNIMLIDSAVAEAQVFYDAANATTLPVLFNQHTLRLELLALLAQHTSVQRLCLVTDNKFMYNNSKLFLNDEPYFTLDDLHFDDLHFADLQASAPVAYSPNIQFLLDVITDYKLTTIDFLACESLTYTSWQQYYQLLQTSGCTVGASIDQTGNLAYGGNWLMESVQQDIQSIYFTATITNYQQTAP